MSDAFSVEVGHDPSGRVCVVALAGKLDPVAVEQLDPVVDRLYQEGHRHFVLDLGRLVYVGSLGLRVLVGLANRVRADGSLGLCGVSAPVRGILDLTKVSTLLHIYPSRADAVDAARSR
jgi:anti-sigma B factor antagonist